MAHQTIRDIITDCDDARRRRLAVFLVNDMPTAMALCLSDDNHSDGDFAPLDDWRIDFDAHDVEAATLPHPIEPDTEEQRLVIDYGRILLDAFDRAHLRQKALRRIAQQCLDGDIADVGSLAKAIERHHVALVHKVIAILVLLALAALFLIYRRLQS